MSIFSQPPAPLPAKGKMFEKYSDDQPRDEQGRFAGGAGASSAKEKASEHQALANHHEESAANARGRNSFHQAMDHQRISDLHQSAADHYNSAARAYERGDNRSAEMHIDRAEAKGNAAASHTEARHLSAH